MALTDSPDSSDNPNRSMAPTDSPDRIENSNQTTAPTDETDGIENTNRTMAPTDSPDDTENRIQDLAPSDSTDSAENPTQKRPQCLKRFMSALKSFKEWRKSVVEQQQPRSPRVSTSNLSGETLVGTEDLEASLEALHIWSA